MVLKLKFLPSNNLLQKKLLNWDVKKFLFSSLLSIFIFILFHSCNVRVMEIIAPYSRMHESLTCAGNSRVWEVFEVLAIEMKNNEKLNFDEMKLCRKRWTREVVEWEEISWKGYSNNQSKKIKIFLFHVKKILKICRKYFC